MSVSSVRSTTLETCGTASAMDVATVLAVATESGVLEAEASPDFTADAALRSGSAESIEPQLVTASAMATQVITSRLVVITIVGSFDLSDSQYCGVIMSPSFRMWTPWPPDVRRTALESRRWRVNRCWQVPFGGCHQRGSHVQIQGWTTGLRIGENSADCMVMRIRPDLDCRLRDDRVARDRG